MCFCDVSMFCVCVWYVFLICYDLRSVSMIFVFFDFCSVFQWCYYVCFNHLSYVFQCALVPSRTCASAASPSSSADSDHYFAYYYDHYYVCILHSAAHTLVCRKAKVNPHSCPAGNLGRRRAEELYSGVLDAGLYGKIRAAATVAFWVAAVVVQRYISTILQTESIRRSTGYQP